MQASYKKLLSVLAINTVLMYLITYAMIASVEHFHVNVNRFYMALMMVAPMAVVMLFAMRSMYEDKKLNAVLAVAFGALFVASFALARTQTLVGDEQFLRSMIPHHSSAILMCEESAISDPEIVALCETIVAAQKEEIAQMESLLERQ